MTAPTNVRAIPPGAAMLTWEHPGDTTRGFRIDRDGKDAGLERLPDDARSVELSGDLSGRWSVLALYPLGTKNWRSAEVEFGAAAPAPVPDPDPEIEPPPAEAVVECDHDTGDFSQWPNSGMGQKHAWCQNVVLLGGDYVARFEVREGQAGPGVKVRSEVGDSTVPKDSEQVYSWRTMIAPEWQDNNGTWYVTTQFHQAPPKWRNGDWGPPPLKFGFSGGQWHIHEWFYAEDHQKTPLYLAAGAKGVWVDWRVHVRWSGGPDGFLHIYRDGKLVVSKTGKNLNGDGGGGTFFKLGIYRGAGDPNTQVCYHDDYRRFAKEDAA